jgi:hypothetical protein
MGNSKETFWEGFERELKGYFKRDQEGVEQKRRKERFPK